MNTMEKIGLILFVISMFAIYDKERTGIDVILPPLVCSVAMIMFLFGGDK